VAKRNINRKVQRLKRSLVLTLSLHRGKDRDSVYNYTVLKRTKSTYNQCLFVFLARQPPRGRGPPHSRGF